MATKTDLELAKSLLRNGVLDEDSVRSAFELQARVAAEKNREVGIHQVLYHLKLVPRGSLDVLYGPPLLEAQPFETYQLEEELGSGGMGTVFRGTYTPNGTPVAVKVLDPVQALRPEFLDRFQREATLHIELEHDNIVQGYETGFEGGYHYYTMDLVDGVTVLDVIERRGFLSNEEALSILVQAASALSYLHSMDMIHRDIKPGNILLDENGHARLIDLGLVGKMGEEGSEGAEATTTVGTVEYLSPEQARGRSDLDARSDLYSLGITLYHMVVGEVPFSGDSDYEVMAKQVLAKVDAQKIKQRRITPEIYFLIAKLAAKERDERTNTAQEAMQIIEGYLPHGLVAVEWGEVPPSEEAPPTIAPVKKQPGGSAPTPTPKRRGGAPRPRRRRR